MKKSRYWVLTNIIGMVLFTYFSSLIWAPKGEISLPVGPGDPLIWVLWILPILIIFSIINIAWLVKVIVGLVKRRDLINLYFFIVIIFVWVILMIYDRSRQYV